MSWIVVRKEKHIDDSYLVFTDVDRALAVAKEIADYWVEQYAGAEIDRDCYGDTIFSVSGDSVFSVEVMPVKIEGTQQKALLKLARWMPFTIAQINNIWREDMPEEEEFIHDLMTPEDWIAAALEAVRRNEEAHYQELGMLSTEEWVAAMEESRPVPAKGCPEGPGVG